jgi:hypothetical protein
LDVTDLEETRDGLIVTIRKSKPSTLKGNRDRALLVLFLIAGPRGGRIGDPFEETKCSSAEVAS